MAMDKASAAGEKRALIQAVERLDETAVLIVGDVMLDEYLTGDADRISPEAPVPVVRIEEDRRLVGGAGNVARNIVALGARAHLVGVRGADQAGENLVEQLNKDGISHDVLILPNRRTTVKTRVMARQQQVVRIDRECAEAHSEAETDALLKLLAARINQSAALVVSDYGKGLVTERMMRGLYSLMADKTIPVLVDPKPQNAALYHGVAIMTPNAKESATIAGMPLRNREEIVAAGTAIMRRTGNPALVITLGRLGMAIFEKGAPARRIPTMAKDVYDVTGAGDTVIALLAMGLGLGLDLITASLLANYAAGIVVGEVGASVVTPNKLAEAIATLPMPEIEIWAGAD